jgi:hypothetical protein
LSGDQVTALQTPEQIAGTEARARDAERKRVERQREREAKTFGSIETKEALWEHNRKLLSESELNALPISRAKFATKSSTKQELQQNNCDRSYSEQGITEDLRKVNLMPKSTGLSRWQ